MTPMDAPPEGIDPSHVRTTLGPRRNSCEAHPGLIQSTHLAPLNEGLMVDDSPKRGIDPAHVVHTRERRNSCEARPGLIQSTHLAPLNECLVAKDDENMPKARMHK
ncbi:hypothetical protein CcaverHIS002_0607770 [Cutaneotrichosporon cavernicola]|uniref:Uncharacterized protein n=1 Tax=Cutaneotrichosporon cavernicola TaxID=279322 RepID=A0AA48QYE4_9TREE|nr:uncharacterized protein CcaverHIS019_0607220 [Cutaneotrichosporon cavernicola]BEI86490.1 hypothetical protein CcaverHIS002_0607770 [Cutaneotrichosporon cavernicola]BEI94263.1 hypothetical protein CcaverHIS019_0607220 [Cutaneotrichosporon cavernicola]BEJ02041.1 hypothetical protein CcaverHIS631_0607230 [Cutaneotrichosporon cavernicola]BEJ09802.1 hypothetical protein CcaverHIS641_0607170 [Cutaneotrichosporon cavernicola]